MIYVLLPAFNEEKGIGEVLASLQQIAAESPEKFRVVVVDDGSADLTSEIARGFESKLDLKLIRFEKNRGVLSVFREGFSYVCRDSVNPEQDICVVLDSDNTQDPLLIPQMAQRIKSGDDLVIASRFEGEGRMVGCPWHRQMFSFVVARIFRIFVGLPRVKDYSTFYRAYRVSLLQRGFEIYGDELLQGKGFAVAGGLLLRLGNLTQRFSEIPLILRYDLKGGKSGNRIWTTIQGYLQLLWDYLRTNRFKKTPSANVVL